MQNLRAEQWANAQWTIPGDPNTGTVATWEAVQLAVLMDIRRELHTLNSHLGCPNTSDIPGLLRRIARNTTKKKVIQNKKRSK